jgi:hypothetical protein
MRAQVAAASDPLAKVVRACRRMPQTAAQNVMAFGLADVHERHKAHYRIYVAILGRKAQQAEVPMRAYVLTPKMSIVRKLARRDRPRRMASRSGFRRCFPPPDRGDRCRLCGCRACRRFRAPVSGAAAGPSAFLALARRSRFGSRRESDRC